MLRTGIWLHILFIVKSLSDTNFKPAIGGYWRTQQQWLYFFVVGLYSLWISVANSVLMSTVLLLKKSSISHYGTMLEVLQPHSLTTSGQNIDMIYFLRLCVIEANWQFNNSAASLNIASLYCLALVKQNGRRRKPSWNAGFPDSFSAFLLLLFLRKYLS